MNLAAGEMVGGSLLLVVGAIMTIGIGLLVCLASGAIYAFVRAVTGPDGLISGDGIVVAGFLALPLGFLILGFFANRASSAKQAKAARFKERAVRADGVITAVWDTGVTINDDPQIRLTVDYRRADNSTAQMEDTLVVSRLRIPRPGELVVVWYDPTGTEATVEFDASAQGVVVDAPSVVDAPPAMVVALERLAALHREGALDAAEFARAKDRLLEN